MTHQEWLNDNETVINNFFVDYHTTKCIDKQKVIDALNKKIEQANSLDDPDSRLCVITYLLSIRKELFGDDNA